MCCIAELRGASQHLKEQLGAAAAALEQRLAHRRQADVGGHLDVVETDHRELLRHANVEDARRLEHAEGLGIRCREDSRRSLREA